MIILNSTPFADSKKKAHFRLVGLFELVSIRVVFFGKLELVDVSKVSKDSNKNNKKVQAYPDTRMFANPRRR